MEAGGVEGAGETAEAREAVADGRLLHQAEAGPQGSCVEAASCGGCAQLFSPFRSLRKNSPCFAMPRHDSNSYQHETEHGQSQCGIRARRRGAVACRRHSNAGASHG